jgi:sphingomyelin phosphodiesterase acid-like 3
MLVCRFIIAILLSIICQFAYADNFLSFSDIHFNPYANCNMVALKRCPLIQELIAAPAKDWEKIFATQNNPHIEGFGHDTNYALLAASMTAIKKINLAEKPQFAVVLGDFLAHHYHLQYVWFSKDHTKMGYERFVKKTLEYLTLQMRNAIPQGDIYAVVGNNDSYTGDYSVIPNGRFLRDTAQTWSTLIKDNNNLKNFTNSFPAGGYYIVNIPNAKNQKLIVLNTVLFSTAATGPYAKLAADKELTWLHAQLAQASKQHQKIILAYHIPTGVNVYALLKNLFGGINEFWQTEYSDAFKDQLQEFAGTVTAILPGHIHIDGSQVIKLNHAADIPVSFNQAISPIFGNNPGFKIYNYNAENLQLAYYDLYVYPLNAQQPDAVWLKKYRKIVGTTIFYPPTLFLNKLSTHAFPSNSHPNG